MSTMLPLAFLLDSVGPGELLVLLAAILILFGGKQMPHIARTIGRTTEQLRRAAQDFRDHLMNEIEPSNRLPPPPPRPLPPAEPAAAPPETSEPAGHPAENETEHTNGASKGPHEHAG